MAVFFEHMTEQIQYIERTTQPTRTPFGEFWMDMHPFIDQEQDGITLYKPGPLFQGEDDSTMPLAHRQIVTVRDEKTGKTVAFDLITKGFEPVQLGQTPRPACKEEPIFMEERTRRLLLESQMLSREIQDENPRSTQLLLRSDEADFVFSTEGREVWEDAVMTPKPGIVLALRTKERIAPGPGGSLLPEDLPDSATIRRAIRKVNRAFALGIDQKTINQVRLSDRENQHPVIKLGEYTMLTPRRIQTPWSESELYLTTYTAVAEDGDTIAIQTLTAKDPREIMLNQEQEEHNPVTIGVERFCPCMRGRRGCDCYYQMEKRLDMLFSDPQTAQDSMFVFLPLDSTMAWGEVWGDMEHRVRAEADGVMRTGTVPHTLTLDVRRAILGQERNTDRTNYNTVARLLQHIYTEPRQFRLISDNKLKIRALESVGTVEIVEAPKHPSFDASYHLSKIDHRQLTVTA